MSFILTLTGPSCAGKTTLERKLKDVGYEAVISTTTRQIREGEVNGQNYYYVTREEFAGLVDSGRLVEHIEFGGNCYGVSVEEVERVLSRGKPVVIVVEPNGLRQIQTYATNMGWKTFSVFVDNPPQVIAERFLHRFITDIESRGGAGKSHVTNTVKTYASRLADMMTVESLWRRDAIDAWMYGRGEDLYDSIIGSFDEENQDRIITSFIDLILDIRDESLIA
ncbi:Gmk Guanylate kinase [uncultured Caudovirales phage]|uniref:Gmk Guanylate kinase n=1 Tax=uncultured Caudovirales phage TaxID=2100421 RepID=A0A6J5KSR2_9CAUD|nr:Gmk Guanylate kinase [uncultured Caudovirales phage]CAB4123967.1 Gmk Guanylate kinase [uncultured Caudovirales phage]CAB5219530.1 Gmk Guanylate kinase [uncultured Caudovirales phage]